MYAWVILKHMHCICVTSSFQVTMTNTLKMYIGYRIYLLIIVKS